MPKRIRPSELAAVLPPDGTIWLQACSAESDLLRTGLSAMAAAPGRMRFTGIFVPGLNKVDYLLSGAGGVETFFQTPELKASGDRVSFLPLSYRDIWRRVSRGRIDAALFMLSPPDEAGLCSFGTVADFLPALWRQIPIRIAHINPRMPRTAGHPGIPFDQLTALVEGEQDLLVATPGHDPTSRAVAAQVAAQVPDGATIQAGLGRVPELAVAALRDHRNLKIHSGLIGDSILDLLDSGALAADAPITAGVAIGTRRLYDAVSSPRFSFRPVDFTHSARILSDIPSLVTINSALEVDLFGQAYSELGPAGLMSGPGGASDFAAGGRMGDDLRIVALASTASGGRTTRIVPPGARAAPVSLGRFDIDVVVTENGAADLRELSHAARAEALVGIAAPDHRDALFEAWRDWEGRVNRK